MDRNEKQNSYKNMISTRGNNREINRLKKRFHLMSVLVVILLAVVVVLGILLGKTWMDSKKEDPASGANMQEEKQGKITENGNTEATEEIKTDDIVVIDETHASSETGDVAAGDGTESKKNTEEESAGDPSEKTDDGNTDGNTPANETERPETEGEVSQESELSSAEMTEGNQGSQDNGAAGRLMEGSARWINLLQNVLNQHTDTDKYRLVFAEKPVDSADFGSLSEAGTWSDSVGSDDLAMLFLVGKVYQCLNDSFGEKPNIENNNNDLRDYCLDAMDRIGGKGKEHPEEILLQRIGETVFAENRELEAQEKTDEEKEAAGLESVNAMLDAVLGNHGSRINGFDETSENGIYLKDLLAYFQKFENAEIWSNDNKSNQTGLETHTRNNLKSLFLENSTKEGGSDFISKLKSQLGDSWNVYWVEDRSAQTSGVYLAILIEENADKEDSQKKAVALGLFADAIENASWSEELANAIAQELANPETADVKSSVDGEANVHSGVTNLLLSSGVDETSVYTAHEEENNPD